MQRTVFKEDIFNEPLIDVGVDHISGSYDFIQRKVFLYNDQSSYFAFAHVQASHDNGHDVFFLILLFFIPFQKSEQAIGAVMRT